MYSESAFLRKEKGENWHDVLANLLILFQCRSYYGWKDERVLRKSGAEPRFRCLGANRSRARLVSRANIPLAFSDLPEFFGFLKEEESFLPRDERRLGVVDGGESFILDRRDLGYD